ncbi:hypothetical protein P2N84_16210, partial [Escherichia coli]
MSRVTAIISALVICIIVCLSWAVNHYRDNAIAYKEQRDKKVSGFAPIFPDTCYHLTHYWPAAADIPV